jgi:hypothetical protein
MKFFVLISFYNCPTKEQAFQNLLALRNQLKSDKIQFDGPFQNPTSEFVPVPQNDDKIGKFVKQFKQRHLYPILLMKTDLDDSDLNSLIFNQENKEVINASIIVTLSEYERLIVLYRDENNPGLIKQFWSEQEILKGFVLK